MEKQANNQRYKILKFLPKAPVSFQNPPFSPGLEKRCDGKLKTPINKVFSGPIIPRIPIEARDRARNFETQEPTSPKVSCIGQVRYKKQVCLQKEIRPVSSRSRKATSSTRSEPLTTPELKRKSSGIKRIFGSRRKSDAGSDHDRRPPLTDRAPTIGQMRRFASSRETLANFDWTTGDLISTPETRDLSSDGVYNNWENDVVIKFSAPIVVARVRAGNDSASEPRKEINLWKRRAMAAQPKPLQLNLVRAQ